MPKMMPKHTEGPWNVVEGCGIENGAVSFVLKAGDKFLGEPCEGSDVPGLIARNWIPTEQAKANARLMSASPDYHAAVQKMMTYEHIGGDGWWKGWEMVKAAHRKASED